MSATAATTVQTETIPAPTSKTMSTPAARRCGTCHKNPLSYNNVSGICTNCQRQHGRPRSKANEHNGAQPAHVNGKAKGNGNGAQPAEDRLFVLPRVVESKRVDLLLAVIPPEEKARMLTAWLAGSF